MPSTPLVSDQGETLYRRCMMAYSAHVVTMLVVDWALLPGIPRTWISHRVILATLAHLVEACKSPKRAYVGIDSELYSGCLLTTRQVTQRCNDY